jgi:hypothetical protein
MGVSQLLVTEKIPEKRNLKGENVYFGSRIHTAVLVHLSLLLWVTGSTIHHGKSTWKKPPHLMMAQKQDRERERDRERKRERDQPQSQYPVCSQ